MKVTNIALLVAGSLMVACSVSTKEEKKEAIIENPAAAGFNLAGSDTAAIRLADGVMKAMGGRENWNNTRYLSWNFFDSRKLLWDKWSGAVRIDFLKQDMQILMNIKDMTGRVFKNGEEITQPDSVSYYLTRGKGIWINDSYWLVMPFKMKDSGVTLKYLRADTTLAGEPSDVVQLTFAQVGNTPDNKYEVWVSKAQRRVNQWAFYSNYADTAARFTLPWGNYQRYGNIWLSDDRGERDLKDIQVLKEVPPNIFSDPEVNM